MGFREHLNESKSVNDDGEVVIDGKLGQAIISKEDDIVEITLDDGKFKTEYSTKEFKKFFGEILKNL